MEGWRFCARCGFDFMGVSGPAPVAGMAAPPPAAPQVAAVAPPFVAPATTPVPGGATSPETQVASGWGPVGPWGPVATPVQSRRRTGILVALGAVVLVLVVGGAGYMALSHGGSGTSTPRQGSWSGDGVSFKVDGSGAVEDFQLSTGGAPPACTDGGAELTLNDTESSEVVVSSGRLIIYANKPLAVSNGHFALKLLADVSGSFGSPTSAGGTFTFKECANLGSYSNPKFSVTGSWQATWASA
jgi:hypothetical protein